MTNERYNYLMYEPGDKKAIITPEELAEGWHWCQEFDGLLRQPMDESDFLNLKGEGFECDCLGDTPWKKLQPKKL